MSKLHSCPGEDLTAAQLYEMLRLRVDVFVVEQECPYPELDGKDLLPGTHHFWLTDGDDIVACLRVLPEIGGRCRIGRVCTAKAGRGSGLAARLMVAALEHTGDVECVLDAQTYAQGFYAKFGFRTIGAEFEEDGIPHITMRRRPLVPNL